MAGRAGLPRWEARRTLGTERNMSETSTLVAELRDRAGKGAARAARRAGRVPGVIYGNKQDPLLISVDPKLLDRALHRPGFFTRLIDLQVGSEKHKVLPRDVQLDPVTDRPLHIDLLRVFRHAGKRICLVRGRHRYRRLGRRRVDLRVQYLFG